MRAYWSKRAKTFKDVVYNSNDQVIVREMVMKYAPPEMQRRMIEEFNAAVDFRNEYMKAHPETFEIHG